MKDENNISKAIEERREKVMKFESAEQKRHYMLEEPVEKLVCRLAVPTILSMLVTSFYNMADTFLWENLIPSPQQRWELSFP